MTDAPRTVRLGWLKNGNLPGDLANAKPCGARTRKGTPCKAPAMRNGRCRMHGGKSTGARTPEGKERARMANWKHGRYSAAVIAERRKAAAVRREVRDLIRVLQEL